MQQFTSLDAAKKTFFDLEKIVDAVDKAERTALAKQAGFVRLFAQRSMRKRNKPSEPGEPPSAHGQQLLKKFLFYGYDERTGSTVVGPMLLNWKQFSNIGPIPQALEQGGTTRVLEVLKAGEWRRADLRSRRRLAGLPMRMRAAVIEARPYMAPAEKAMRAKFAMQFKDTVK